MKQQLIDMFQAQLNEQAQRQQEQNQKFLSVLTQFTQASEENENKQEQAEIIEPMLLHKDVKAPVMFRMHSEKMRYYFALDKDQKAQFYPSVTTILNKTTPLSYGLQKLMMDKGDNFWDFFNQKAKYGTFIHMQIADYLINNEYDFDDVERKIDEYAKEQHIKFDYSNWKWTAKKDIASLIQFTKEYNVKPLAIEVVVKYRAAGGECFAGAVDMICEMDWEEKGYFGEVYKSGPNKGEPKESKSVKSITAIVDFKSGKSGFFEDHEEQLHMYKLAVEQSLDLKIDKVFNVAPSDWRTQPTFKIKDQTDSTTAQKIGYHLKLFYLDYEGPKVPVQITGKVNGQAIEKNIKHMDAEEYVLTLQKVKEYITNKKTNGVSGNNAASIAAPNKN